MGMITDWPSMAACQNGDPDALFVQGAEQNVAKRICRSCPVRYECLADALDNRIEFGVWGGMTERERRALLRRHPQVASWRKMFEAAMKEKGADKELVSDRLTSVGRLTPVTAGERGTDRPQPVDVMDVGGLRRDRDHRDVRERVGERARPPRASRSACSTSAGVDRAARRRSTCVLARLVQARPRRPRSRRRPARHRRRGAPG